MAKTKGVDEQVQDGAQDEKPASKNVSLAAGIKECSTLLVDVPDALDFSVKKDENERHYQSFDNQSTEAAEVREKIAKILRAVYDGGMYSYRQFSEPLRVESIAIMGLLDEEFREQNNLA